VLVSRHLETIRKSIEGKVTLGSIVESMRHSGFGLIMVFLCLPFLQPIPMAGLSTALGGILFLLGVQLMMHRKTVWIPAFIARREVKESTGQSLLLAAARFFKFIETFVKPRLSHLAEAERFMGLLIAISAMMLAMPLPIPFSNMLCAVPIVLLALSLLERDGVMTILGISAFLLSIAFHTMLVILGVEGIRLLYQNIVNHWL
jgi:hypothetical protein